MLSRWLLESRLNTRTLQLHKLQPTQGGFRLAEAGLAGLSLCMLRGWSALAAIIANGRERQGGEAIYGGLLFDLIPAYDYGRILPGGGLPNSGSAADSEYDANVKYDGYMVGGDDDPRLNETHEAWGKIGSNLSNFGTFTTANTRTFSQSRVERWRTRRLVTERACP